MASGYCKYCGKYSENLLIGGYCSSTCQSNFDIEYNKQYYANLKAEREKQDQITRDKIKTGASVASAILLAEQNAILKQQQAQAQAQAIAEARAKQAKKEDLAKSYGFENAADAAYWINQVGEDDSIEDALKLKQKTLEEKKRKQKESNEYLTRKRQEEYREKEAGKKELFTYMTDEQKTRNNKIRQVASWFEEDHTDTAAILMVFICILFLIAGIIIYAIFRNRLLPIGFFRFITTFNVLGALVGKFFVDLRVKARINKIARIKGKDDFPFYVISDFKLSGLAHYDTAWIKITAFIALFFWIFRIRLPAFNTLFHVFLVIGAIIFVIVKFLYTFQIFEKKDDNIYKHGSIYDPNTNDIENCDSYHYVKYARRKIGPYLDSYNSTAFKEWKNGMGGEGNGRHWWAFTFLPEHEDIAFNDKWRKLTSPNQVMSYDAARAKWSKSKSKQISNESIRWHEELKKEYDNYFGEKGKLYETYFEIKKRVDANSGAFDESLKSKFDKFISKQLPKHPDLEKLKNQNKVDSLKSFYDIRCNFMIITLWQKANKYLQL